MLGYGAWAHWAWGDIPVATLEQRYGGSSLQQVEIDGLPIRYRLQGPADAPVLVLIHNHFLDMGMWDAWVKELDSDFRLLRYDLAGHGLTGPDPSGIYTVDRDVALLAGLLDDLDLERVHLAGSSLGGNIAFHFAAAHPDRVERLVLINSGGLKRPGSNSEREMPAWADGVFPLVPPVAFHRFLEWMAADKAAITDALRERFVAMFRRAGNRRAELARLRQFDSGEPAPVLARVRAPTLILWGADNPQLPAHLAEEFVARLSGTHATPRIFPGAGHLLPLEQPARSAATVRQFLQEAGG